MKRNGGLNNMKMLTIICLSLLTVGSAFSTELVNKGVLSSDSLNKEKEEISEQLMGKEGKI